MNGLMMQMYIKMLQAKQSFLEEERGAVDIVAIVVLIGVAVALALFFKDQIVKILTSLFGNIESEALKSTSGI